ncbi:MAG: hypothetical protein QXX30_00325 [Candidatus Aenigmatarchaeota archaeon]
MAGTRIKKFLKTLFIALFVLYSLGLYLEFNVNVNGEKHSFSIESKQNSFYIETNFGE